jgi:hypothetical protein
LTEGDVSERKELEFEGAASPAGSFVYWVCSRNQLGTISYDPASLAKSAEFS